MPGASTSSTSTTSVEASEGAGGTDITNYTVNSGGTTGTQVVLDITGSGVLLGGFIFGPKPADMSNVDITVDGAEFSADIIGPETDTGSRVGIAIIPAARFDSDLKITFNTNNSGRDSAGMAWVKQ